MFEVHSESSSHIHAHTETHIAEWMQMTEMIASIFKIVFTLKLSTRHLPLIKGTKVRKVFSIFFKKKSTIDAHKGDGGRMKNGNSNYSNINFSIYFRIVK